MSTPLTQSTLVNDLLTQSYEGLSVREAYLYACERAAVKPNTGVLHYLPIDPLGPAATSTSALSIVEIDLSMTFIGPGGAVPLAVVVLLSPRLQTLPLPNTGLDNDAMSALADAVRGHPSLRVLDIRHNKDVSTPAVFHLCRALLRNHSLHIVLYEGCSISVKHAMKFETYLSHNYMEWSKRTDTTQDPSAKHDMSRSLRLDGARTYTVQNSSATVPVRFAELHTAARVPPVTMPTGNPDHPLLPKLTGDELRWIHQQFKAEDTDAIGRITSIAATRAVGKVVRAPLRCTEVSTETVMVPPSEKVQATFTAIDADVDGYITKAEFVTFCRNILMFEAALSHAEAVESIFSLHDTNSRFTAVADLFRLCFEKQSLVTARMFDKEGKYLLEYFSALACTSADGARENLASSVPVNDWLEAYVLTAILHDVELRNAVIYHKVPFAVPLP
jgi:hypothetical protein